MRLRPKKTQLPYVGDSVEFETLSKNPDKNRIGGVVVGISINNYDGTLRALIFSTEQDGVPTKYLDCKMPRLLVRSPYTKEMMRRGREGQHTFPLPGDVVRTEDREQNFPVGEVSIDETGSVSITPKRRTHEYESPVFYPIGKFEIVKRGTLAKEFGLSEM